MHHDSDVAFHRFWIGVDCISRSAVNIKSFAFWQIKIVEINLLPFDTGTATPPGAHTFMRVPQGGIVTQAAYDMESHGTGLIDKRSLWEPGVSNDVGCNFQQTFPKSAHHVEIPFGQAVFLTKFGHPLLSRSLFGAEHNAVVGINIHNADAENLQPAFCLRGTSRPELSDIGSLIPRFWDIAGVYGDGLAAALNETHIHQRRVELHPVKGTLEELTEPLLATVGVATHLGEINLARNYHV